MEISMICAEIPEDRLDVVLKKIISVSRKNCTAVERERVRKEVHNLLSTFLSVDEQGPRTVRDIVLLSCAIARYDLVAAIGDKKVAAGLRRRAVEDIKSAMERLCSTDTTESRLYNALATGNRLATVQFGSFVTLQNLLDCLMVPSFGE